MGVYQDSTNFDEFLGGWVDGVYYLLVLDKVRSFQGIQMSFGHLSLTGMSL